MLQNGCGERLPPPDIDPNRHWLVARTLASPREGSLVFADEKYDPHTSVIRRDYLPNSLTGYAGG